MPRTTTSFEIERLEILSEDGSVDEDLVPDLSNDTLMELWYHMKRGRRLDERALKLSYGGRIHIFAPAKGQEAAQVGTAFALREKDWMVPSYRDHVAGIVKGLPLEYIIQYWGGDERGNAVSTSSNVYPVSVPVGSQPLHAVGEAYAHQKDGDDHVVMTYFGDGATSTGDTQEAMNFAGAWQVPAIFVCQNNQYAISVPRKEKQTSAETIAQKAIGYGIPGIQVDGNDIFAVYKATMKAFERAKNGEGPTLIECETYRRGPHTTPDDPSRYRSDEEEEKWKKKDPLKRFKQYLLDHDVMEESEFTEMEENINEELAEAISRFQSSDEQDPTSIFDTIYEEQTWNLREQQEEMDSNK